MLTADSITVKGRHDQLVGPTSVQLQRGELQLLVSEPQISRTALALVLSGRMAPSSGTVVWNADPKLRTLRKHSALVDSPGINEPESHLKVCDLVAEDLGLIPGPNWRKPGARKWMAQHGFDDIASCWSDAIDPGRLFELQLLLAAENPRLELLIVDSPDRHDLEDEHWLETLENFASSHREFAVLAIVSRLPQCWQPQTGQAADPEPAVLPLPDPSTGFIQGELDLGLDHLAMAEGIAANHDFFLPADELADAVQCEAKE
ncbi:ABC transporter ATP-binding protein [Glutamicibacter sp. NPDC087661]|uniref:ABC transporter ATP-binding protein n=1 Tax=Glutamicibacter sp. NPDC087661 TaxID=3363996 RepID=UPI0038282C55